MSNAQGFLMSNTVWNCPQCGPAGVDIIRFSRHRHLPKSRELAVGYIQACKLFADLDLNEQMTGLVVVNLGWVLQCSHAQFPVVGDVANTE